MTEPIITRFNDELQESFSQQWAEDWYVVAKYQLFDDTDHSEDNDTDHDGVVVTAVVSRSDFGQWAVSVNGYQPKKSVEPNAVRVLSGHKTAPTDRSLIEYTLLVETASMDRCMSIELTEWMTSRIIAQAKADTGLL